MHIPGYKGATVPVTTSSQVLLRLEFWTKFFFWYFFRKETHQKNVFVVETSFFTTWGRRFPWCPLFWRVINFFKWYPGIQTSWATSGNLSCIILMLLSNSGLIGPENKWKVSFLIWPPVTYIQCSHGVHFSKVSKIFKLNQYLTNGLADHRPSSYGLSKHL